MGIVPEIGQRWVGQGGDYVGILRIPGLPDQHVIIAPPSLDDAWHKWSPVKTKVLGAHSLLNGRTNTLALIAAGNHPAALFASGYNLEGHSDYHLGALDEMQLAWENLPKPSSNGVLMYWTSTQSSPSTAWIHGFDDGQSDTVDKSTPVRVRPVRWIPVS